MGDNDGHIVRSQTGSVGRELKRLLSASVDLPPGKRAKHPGSDFSSVQGCPGTEHENAASAGERCCNGSTAFGHETDRSVDRFRLFVNLVVHMERVPFTNVVRKLLIHERIVSRECSK
jgi:hypothetical protein